MNTFGIKLKVTTFGESHGSGIGCIIDGFPAGVKINLDLLDLEMARRAPGKNQYSTQRKESDSVEILSGVFNGFSTGTPIGLFIANTNTKSSDYDNIKDVFRPGHADFTYFYKYGIRDYRGGGRSSARESAARVAAGAFAKMLLSEFDIKLHSGIFAIGSVESKQIDFEYALQSEIYSLDKDTEQEQKKVIMDAKNSHDSIGGVALIEAVNLPIGLGEPLYYKLDSALGAALLGLNAVKAIEIGDGIKSSYLLGSECNDTMDGNGFISNHCGGTLGGISNGENLIIKVHFKPTPSIFKPQKTQNINKEEVELSIKGRHDPCVAVRGSVVAESMTALVLADMLLLNATSKLEYLKKIY